MENNRRLPFCAINKPAQFKDGRFISVRLMGTRSKSQPICTKITTDFCKCNRTQTAKFQKDCYINAVVSNEH